MSNRWQEATTMDNPWDAEEDGWGPPTTGAKAPESWLGSSPASGWSAPGLEKPSESRQHGDSGPPSSEARNVPASLPASDNAWDDPAEESSWLSAGPSSSQGVFAPRWADSEAATDEADESWLENEDDEFSALSEGEPVADSGGGGALWLVVVALGLLTVFGLWSLGREEPKTAIDPQAEAVAQALESGRLLVGAGQQSLQSQQAESAASQLRKAVEELGEGEAPAAEIWKARRLLAVAASRSGQLEESHALWSQLATQEAFRVEAASAVRQTAAELRKSAARRLDQAGALLAQGEAAGAAALAKESLSIYQRYDGDRAQLGRANGALGSALSKQGRLGAARSYLAAAVRHWPENRSYAVALDALGAGPYDKVPEVEVSTANPAPATAVSGRIQVDADYPTGQTGIASGSSGSAASSSASGAVTETTASQVSHQSNSGSNGGGRPSGKPKPSPDTKLGDKDVLATYRDSGRRR